MRVLAIVDPPRTLHALSDTTVAFLDELSLRGHELWVCELHELRLRHGKPGADAHAVRAVQRKNPHEPALTFDAAATSHPLEFFDVVLIRKDPPYDTAYHLAMLILEYGRDKSFIMNDPRGLREANEKLYIFHFPELLAPTLVTHRADELREFMAEQGGEMVVKPLEGYGGLSVFHVRQSDPNTSTILEVMTSDPQRHGAKRWVMAQRYLDIGRYGDKRILLLGGEPVGALLRMPKKGEIRSNLAVGGTGQTTELTEREREICARIKPKLIADGLHFVGIDVIGGNLTEVNVTSPTGVQAIDRLYGIRLESRVADFLEERVKQKRAN